MSTSNDFVQVFAIQDARTLYFSMVLGFHQRSAGFDSRDTLCSPRNILSILAARVPSSKEINLGAPTLAVASMRSPCDFQRLYALFTLGIIHLAN